MLWNLLSVLMVHQIDIRTFYNPKYKYKWQILITNACKLRQLSAKLRQMNYDAPNLNRFLLVKKVKGESYTDFLQNEI